jgi:hypothetical protein
MLLIASIVTVGALTSIAEAAPKVRVYKDTLTLQSYDWRSALVSTDSTDPIYPYPRLNFDKVGGPRSITTTVIVLESPGARVTVAPEYGGRILRWFDKRNNRDVLYVNPVIKPTGWGYRGWWLATGGIEWAFPTNEHGLNEWRPWRYQMYSGSGYAAVVVSDHEDRTGLDISVSIILYSNDNIVIIPRISNRTRTPQHFQFWINAMLPYASDAQFDLPAKQVEVHSTGDDSLPESGQKMSWPIFNGRDFSRASEWRQYLGVFAAPATSGRAAVRYPSIGAKITRTFPASLARGVKLFLLGDLPADLYTDGDSRYLELWGGYTRTFGEDATLQPGRSVTWSETWSTR